jgi:hypothetical protein
MLALLLLLPPAVGPLLMSSSWKLISSKLGFVVDRPPDVFDEETRLEGVPGSEEDDVEEEDEGLLPLLLLTVAFVAVQLPPGTI